MRVILDILHEGDVVASTELLLEADEAPMWAWLRSNPPKRARGGIATARRTDGKGKAILVATSVHHLDGPKWTAYR